MQSRQSQVPLNPGGSTTPITHPRQRNEDVSWLTRFHTSNLTRGAVSQALQAKSVLYLDS